MSEQRLNIELFKKVRDRIATIPESYDQSVFEHRSRKSPCGTVACIAGEAIICAWPSIETGVKALKHINNDMRNRWSVADCAAVLLGLTGSFDRLTDYDDLEGAGETAMFDGDAAHWPSPYRQQFECGKQAEAAVAYLDHIIETGKVLE